MNVETDIMIASSVATATDTNTRKFSDFRTIKTIWQFQAKTSNCPDFLNLKIYSNSLLNLNSDKTVKILFSKSRFLWMPSNSLCSQTDYLRG